MVVMYLYQKHFVTGSAFDVRLEKDGSSHINHGFRYRHSLNAGQLLLHR